MLWQNKCFVFNFFTFPRHPPISSNIFIWKTLFDIINHWELQKSQTSLDRFTCDIHLVKMLLGKSVVIYVLENILKLHLNVVHYSVQGYSGCWIHTSEMEVAPSEAISVHLSFCSGANESLRYWLNVSASIPCKLSEAFSRRQETELPSRSNLTELSRPFEICLASGCFKTNRIFEWMDE